MVDSTYLLICIIAFAAMFGGALIGIFTARALPDHHLNPESATVVKLATAVVVSLTSLVLALMLSSANNSFSANTGIVKKLSSDFIQLDHMLRAYGPQANDARAALRSYATKKNDELFPAAGTPPTSDRVTADLLDALLVAVLALPPTDHRQTALVAQALAVTTNIYAERWLLWANPGTAVPVQFLVVMIFWLFLIFVSFGLFAPANGTVVASFFLSALAVAAAILMILELGDPMHRSLLQISGDPMRRALIEITRP